MISRIRPYFNEKYFNAISNFDPEITRDEYCLELTKQLHKYYPKAHTFEFFNYGRNALGAGLDLLDIHENDEIILPCFTCSTVLDPILKRRIIPKLVDINFDFSFKIEQVEKVITKKTKAIMVTHFFGIPTNLLEIKKIAEIFDLYIIEDCAHTFCQQTSFSVGSIGDIAFTSHGNEKPLSLGNGGILIINNYEKSGNIYTITSKIPNESLYNEKCSFLSLACFDYATETLRYNYFIGTSSFYNYIVDNPQKFQSLVDDVIHYHELDIIYNSFNDNFQKRKNVNSLQKMCNIFKRGIFTPHQHDPKLMNTFLLQLFLKILPEIDRVNEARNKKGRIYIDNLSGNSDFFFPQDRRAPYLRYSILCKKPALTHSLINKLVREKFEVGNYNWGQTLNHILKIKEKFEISEYICDNVINLPCYPSLHDEEINKISQIINNFTN